MVLNPTRQEIQDWFDQKIRDFVEKEKQNPELTIDQQLENYMHDGPLKYFFSEFFIIFYDWLARLTYRKTNLQGGEPTRQTSELIQQFQEVDNKASRDVEVCIASILEGYITEFMVDIGKSYNNAEREFFSGPRGRFLLSLQLSIKMIIYEKDILKMNSTEQNYGVRRLWVSRRQGLDGMI